MTKQNDSRAGSLLIRTNHDKGKNHEMHTHEEERQSVTPRQGTRGCREDLPPVPLRLLPAEPTRAALARASRSARARQQASLTCQMSNSHDGSAADLIGRSQAEAEGHRARDSSGRL